MKSLIFCKTSYVKPVETKIQLYPLTKRVKQNKCLRKFLRIELDLNSNCIENTSFVIQNIFIFWIWFVSLINIRVTFFGELKIIFEADRIPSEWIPMSLKGSRHFSLVDPISAAYKIPAAFQPLITISFLFSDVIWSYIFITHFACNGFIFVSGVSFVSQFPQLQDLSLKLL